MSAAAVARSAPSETLIAVPPMFDDQVHMCCDFCSPALLRAMCGADLRGVAQVGYRGDVCPRCEELLEPHLRALH